MKHNIEFKVELGETQAAGIVFYPNYFRWFDRATHELLRSIGLVHSQLMQHYKLIQPVMECSCTFLRPLRYDDTVRIESTVVDVQETTFKLEHHIFHEDTLIGSGIELRVWIKLDESDEVLQMSTVSIPEAMAKMLKKNN